MPTTEFRVNLDFQEKRSTRLFYASQAFDIKNGRYIAFKEIGTENQLPRPPEDEQSKRLLRAFDAFRQIDEVNYVVDGRVARDQFSQHLRD